MAQQVTRCENCGEVTRYHGSHIVKMKERIDIPGVPRSLSRIEEFDARLCHRCYINAGYKERRKKGIKCDCLIGDNPETLIPCKLHLKWKEAA